MLYKYCGPPHHLMQGGNVTGTNVPPPPLAVGYLLELLGDQNMYNSRRFFDKPFSRK